MTENTYLMVAKKRGSDHATKSQQLICDFLNQRAFNHCMETTGYDSSSNLSGEEEVTKKQLVTKIRETLDDVVEELYRIQQDVALLGDSISQAHKLLKLLEDDGDVFIIPTDNRFIGTTGDEWRIEHTPAQERSEGPGNNDIILVNADILEEQKPAAQPSKKDTRLAGQQRAREWAKQQFKKP